VEEMGPDSADDSAAKAVALALQGTLPVVHGAGPTVAAARRWKTQLNENAAAAAFWSELPEANHNEICGWERGLARAPLSAVFLEDPDQHPRIHRRIELNCAEVDRAGGVVLRVESRGDSRLERVLSLVLLGDLVSVYLAVLDGVDPTPVELLERFKAELAKP
jgi:glucose/mannose-6-phosphate isomerase